MNEEVPSPCVKICVLDTETGYCLGCYRTSDEIEMWGEPKTTNEWKRNNLLEIEKRESA